jgi:predicted RNA binding protein YcfA (HicA-like mRNA interferase family)
MIKLVEQDGWYHVSTRGSHRQFKHPSKAGKVTIAGHPSDELHPKTVKSILEQAQMEV